MANITTYLENKLLNHSLGGPSYTMPTTVYAALYTVAPTNAGGGTELYVQNGYIRQPITFGSASNGSKANSADLRWPPSGIASGPWTSVNSGSTPQSIIAVGVLDALSNGNLLYFGPLSASQVISNGNDFKIAAGGLTITLS